VHLLEESDEKLLETKSLLNTLKTEFISARTAYENVLNKLKIEEDKLEKSLQERERIYK
jgi:hypothetical protein